MTGWRKRQVVELAREAGFEGCAELTWEGVICTEELKAFAKLVREDEREACAKVCEAEADDGTEGEWDTCCLSLARRIRDRGQA